MNTIIYSLVTFYIDNPSRNVVWLVCLSETLAYKLLTVRRIMTDSTTAFLGTPIKIVHRSKQMINDFFILNFVTDFLYFVTDFFFLRLFKKTNFIIFNEKVIIFIIIFNVSRFSFSRLEWQNWVYQTGHWLASLSRYVQCTSEIWK